MKRGNHHEEARPEPVSLALSGHRAAAPRFTLRGPVPWRERPDASRGPAPDISNRSRRHRKWEEQRGGRPPWRMKWSRSKGQFFLSSVIRCGNNLENFGQKSFFYLFFREIPQEHILHWAARTGFWRREKKNGQQQQHPSIHPSQLFSSFRPASACGSSW